MYIYIHVSIGICTCVCVRACVSGGAVCVCIYVCSVCLSVYACVCCKITLEVLEGNEVARSAYRKFGFDGAKFDPAYGAMLFWNKPL